MADTKLPLLSIREASGLIQQRKLSPVELVEATLARIERLQPVLNDYITVMAAEARRDARRAERELAAGRYRGPLHGIPIGLKDLYATKGVRTTAGSKILADWVPDHDATVTAKLRRVGAVIIGKHNCHEFAAGATNNNPHYGPARNPWDQYRVPGGSSGGTGASVTAGTCMGGMGTDTGGSVRIPSCLSGNVGLKPTYGRVSRHGITPLSYSQDHAGPMARTVWDCAAMLEAVAGYDPKDPSSARVPVRRYTAALEGVSLSGVRVGLPREHFWDEASEEVAGLARRAVLLLEELGARVVEVSLPSVHLSPTVGNVISWSESASWHEEWLRTRPDDYGADVRQRFQTGLLLRAVQYHKAQRLRRVIQQEMLDALKQADVLVTPTCAVGAPPIGEAVTQVKGRGVNTLLLLSRLTRPFNVSGLPALTVPCGFTRDGLPVGLQVAGRPFDETRVLQVGHAYEQATPWHTRRPEL